MSISQGQRFRKSSPCPICGGWDQTQRGKGVRCFGFLSDDGAFAHCTREEHAGNLQQSASSGTYAHKLQGPCGCGAEHGPRPAASKGTNAPKGRIVTTYDYLDGTGQLRHQTVRYEPKSFKQRRPDGNGGWIWNLKGIQAVLYHLPELLAADPQDPVLILEGEKDVEAARSLGYVATCNPMGAGKWRASYGADLASRQVLIIADADTPGRRHAQQIAFSLKSVAASVKVIELPGPGKDVSDWLDAGHTAQEFQALVDSVPLWTPAPPSTNGCKPDAVKSRHARTEDGDLLHLTDLGNGRRLVARHGEDSRFCYPFGHFWVWDGTRWSKDDAGQMESWAKDTALSIYAEAAAFYAKAAELKALHPEDPTAGDATKAAGDSVWAWARRSESVPALAAMLKAARSEPGIPVSPASLDADPWLLNCENGTLDLRTGQLRPHQREDLLTKMAPVDFAPDAHLELWDRFLSEAIPDADTRAYVQRLVGATLVGKQRDDLIILVHGPGGTGKTTFREAIMGALGDYAATADLETFTTRTSAHGPQPDLARLAGKRLVAVSEVEGAGPVMSLLKRATGGDMLHARHLYGSTFQFEPQFTLWILANERPRVPDTDSGLKRRVVEIPFNIRFAKPDPNVRDTLKNADVAGPAILAWAVRGCLDWQAQGIGERPKQVVEATGNYWQDMDPLGDWLRDCALEKQDTFTRGAKLWESYLTWSKSNNVTRPLGRKGFGQRLRARYEASHSDKGVLFLGVELLAEPTFQIAADGSQPSAKANTPEISQVNPLHVGTFRNQPSATVSQLEIEPAAQPSAEASPNRQQVSAEPSAGGPEASADPCVCPPAERGEPVAGPPCPDCRGTLRCPECGGCRRCGVASQAPGGGQ